jgi:diguanylate cyclase (GGDEF)-like protein
MGVPLLAACAVPVFVPGARVAGDIAMAAFGLLAAAVLWFAPVPEHAGRSSRRLFSIGCMFPVLGAALAWLVPTHGPLEFVVLRWVPTVPGYVMAIVALLSLVDRGRLRAGGRRHAVELVLFGLSCMLTVQLLVLGPGGRVQGFGWGEQTVLVVAVLATSSTMAAALTLLGAVEARRRRMALVLLAAFAFLTAGRGLATSAMLSGATDLQDASRFLVVAGLGLLVLGALSDPGPGVEPDRSGADASTSLGQVLPHVAMLVSGVAVGTSFLLGYHVAPATAAGLLGCVVLATVHRWLSLRDERRMGARLQRSESYFRSLVHSSGDAVLILDSDLRVSWASTALERMVGPVAAADLVGRPLLDAVHPEDVRALAAALRQAGGATSEGAPGPAPEATPETAVEPAAALILLRLPDSDGTWRFLEAGVSDLRRDADVGAVVVHCRDMTERLAREQALQSIAYTDPMTGLPNQAGWLRALERSVADGSGGAALLLIELDGLAEAREHTGREGVSAVVAEVGRRLRATVRGEDLVARLGGGAFSVLAGGSAAEADRLAARCLAVVEQPIRTPSGVLELTAGIGLAAMEPDLSVDGLRSRAELAVRAARAAGPGTAVRYSAELGAAAERGERLRVDIEGAAARGELALAFLPVVSLSEQRVSGVEALLRWRHPELGQLPPAEFLPIAERAGLMGELQLWVLRQATAAAMALPVSGCPLNVAVNVSAGYLRGGTAVADVQAALDASGLAPDRLVLELTDAALLAAEERVGLDIATLRLMGVHVALDDFGTGDSALGHLTALPLDGLKLDVSLVARVDRDEHARALCELIVGIGRRLDLQVVAEGVETPAQLAVLLGIGCGFAQGFLLGRPTSLPELTALLQDGAGQLWPGLVGQR